MRVQGKEFSLSHVESNAPGEHVEVWVASDGQVIKIGCEERVTPEVLDYRELRRRAYPPIGDQLDAIWKALGYLQMKKKLNLVAEADDILGAILNVKKRYPKDPVIVLED